MIAVLSCLEKIKMNGKILILFLTLVICASCALSPEAEDRRELTPALKQLDAPTGLAVVNDHAGRRIELSWNEVSGATHYIVEYQRATDYLSGREMKTYVTQDTSFILSTFVNSSDMRYVFRVKAAYRDSVRSLESAYTPEMEGAIVDDITITPIIRDSYLCFYVSHAKVNSILTDVTIADCRVTFHEGDYTEGEIPADVPVLESGKRFVNSNETVTVTAVLTVDGREIRKKAATVRSDVSYTPRPLISLEGTKGDAGGVTLTWVCPPLNDGLTDTEVFFRIERREKGASVWTEVRSSEENGLHSPSAETDITDEFTVTYTDTTAESGHDYFYRVTSMYLTGENGSAFWTSEDSAGVKTTDACHVMDTSLRALVLNESNPAVMNSDGNWEVKLKFSFETYHELPEGASVTLQRTPSDEADESLAKTIEGITSGSVDDTIILTPEQKKDPKLFSYSAAIKYADGSTGTAVNAVNPDGTPVTIQIAGEDMVAIYEEDSLSATNDLADRTELTWSVRSSGYPEDFNTSKVTFTVYRTDGESMTEFTGIPFGTCSYTDEISAGESYSYRVRAVYTQDDENAPDHKYVRNYPYSDVKTGSSIPSVTGLEVSRNSFTDRIKLSWEGPAGAVCYRVTYIPEGGSSTSHDTSETSFEITDIPEAYYGKNVSVSVRAIDRNGNVQQNGAEGEGMILGPASVTVADGAKDITVTWDAIEGASRYKVSVYNSESDDSPIASEVINASSELKFTLSSDSDIIRNNTSVPYPLSKSYWFSVSPIVGTTAPVTEKKAEGSWIQPPTGITASKAEYRDMITLKWNAVDGAERYIVYRKGRAGSWESLMSVSLPKADIITDDEAGVFSVATISASGEGPVQESFTGDENYGYPLMKPGNLSGNDFGSNLFRFCFNKVEGATEYLMELNGLRLPDLSQDTVNNAPSHLDEPYDGAVELSENGLISYYCSRIPVKDIAYFTFSVAAKNSGAAIPSKDTTASSMIKGYYESLTQEEIINIAAYNLREVFRTVDAAFEGDWYKAAGKSYGEPGLTAVSGYWITDKAKYGEGYVRLDGFYINGNYISTESDITFTVKDRWNATVPNSLVSVSVEQPIVIQLPGRFHDISVTFNNYQVSNDKTGTSAITIHCEALPGGSVTLDTLPVSLIKEMRR